MTPSRGRSRKVLADYHSSLFAFVYPKDRSVGEEPWARSVLHILLSCELPHWTKVALQPCLEPHLSNSSCSRIPLLAPLNRFSSYSERAWIDPSRKPSRSRTMRTADGLATVAGVNCRASRHSLTLASEMRGISR